jgi:glycosyltransferase involved in cell wall biosynthesis
VNVWMTISEPISARCRSHTFCSLYMKWLYFPFFDHHVANSQYTAAELRSAAQGHWVERGTWVRHMGVDLEHFSPARRAKTQRRRLLEYFGVSDESVLLLYVGRLVPEKNLSLLFDLLLYLVRKSQRDFRLLVVGDGIQRKHWERESNQRIPRRVVFLGHIQDRNRLADLYANADIFIHPNPREPFGIAPLEAMASALPLVAPNSGGIISYANRENAWVVDPTIEQFAAAVHQIVANPALKLAKTKAALETARQYEWSRVASSFLDLYGELHRATQNSTAAAPAPEFYSTPAAGAGSVFMHTVSAMAVRTFKMLSGRCLEPRVVPRGSNVLPKP